MYLKRPIGGPRRMNIQPIRFNGEPPGMKFELDGLKHEPFRLGEIAA